jgi:hypothetical protein
MIECNPGWIFPSSNTVINRDTDPTSYANGTPPRKASVLATRSVVIGGLL